MNEKNLVIALVAILGIGFIGIFFVVFPWVFSHGFSDWKQTLMGKDGTCQKQIYFTSTF